MLFLQGKIYHAEFTIKGKRFRRSTGTTNRREAEKKERQLKTEIRASLEKTSVDLVKPKVYREALLRWIETDAPQSMFSHARNTRPYLDDVALTDIVPHVTAMKEDFKKRGLSPLTINRRLAVVRRVLNVAFEEYNWISEPLGKKIKLLSEKGLAREVFLSKEEVDALLAAVKDTEVRKVLALAVYTGLRQGEILSLNESNWRAPYIVLTNDETKSGKGRSVPIIEELHDIVTLPFNTTYARVRRGFELARKTIGRPDIRFHDLRHTYASWLAQNPDIPLTTIRDLLGHSNLSVTSKYAHLRGQTFDAVSAALGTPKGTPSPATTH